MPSLLCPLTFIAYLYSVPSPEFRIEVFISFTEDIVLVQLETNC